MVKFGRHQKFFLDENPGTYVVPYNVCKTTIEGDSITENDFESQWRTYLQNAREEFDSSLQGVWRQVFSALSRFDVEDGRGAPPEKALILFTQYAPAQLVHEVLSAFNRVHATALVNAEALRKLVKKFDKNYHQKKMKSEGIEELPSESRTLSLSCKLLPEVYAANFVVGLTALQQGIELLRSELALGDLTKTPETLDSAFLPTEADYPGSQREESIGMNIDGGDSQEFTNFSNQKIPEKSRYEQDTIQKHTFTMLSKNDRKDSNFEHLQLVDRRREELQWLKSSMERLEHLQLLPNLVAHRGFHSPKDRSDRRPMENCLHAYESAWTSGIHLCECDIALTKDERLILAHDDDFSRLALDASCEKSRRNVRDLTFQEIMSVALKSGSRPPLLWDVLQSAHAIGGNAQLIIEIKPGNRDAASALARMFEANPHLMARCAVVMSFDSFVMHALYDEMNAIFGTGEIINAKGNHRRCYSMGLMPVLSVTRMEGAPAYRATKHARPKLLILTVNHEPNKEVELQVSINDPDYKEKILGWIKGRLDGVYMQFEPEMVTPEGAQAMKNLARRYYVGVWGCHGRDPDQYDTFQNLVQEGHVSFVNTDLPREFFDPEHPAPST